MLTTIVMNTDVKRLTLKVGDNEVLTVALSDENMLYLTQWKNIIQQNTGVRDLFSKNMININQSETDKIINDKAKCGRNTIIRDLQQKLFLHRLVIVVLTCLFLLSMFRPLWN